MSQPNKRKPSLSRWVAWVASLLWQDPGSVVMLLAYGLQMARSLFATRRHGIYEVLSDTATVELLDNQGQEVVVTRTQRVRFLRDNNIAFFDTCWGDGNLFAEYACSPGVPVDFFPDGARYRVLISLRETKNHGDVVTFHIRRKIKGGFTRKGEWWEMEVLHNTRWLGVTIVFPQDRRCREATITQKSNDHTGSLGAEHFHTLPDGRQELSWEVSHPPLHEHYTLKWRW